jgi:hypothetical protein
LIAIAKLPGKDRLNDYLMSCLMYHLGSQASRPERGLAGKFGLAATAI